VHVLTIDQEFFRKGFRELELDASTLSRTVDGLVKAGLLSRKEDPDNRRRQLVCLSPAGRTKADSINALCDRYFEDLLGALPAREAAVLMKAIPLFAKALRDWRLAGNRCSGAAGARR